MKLRFAGAAMALGWLAPGIGLAQTLPPDIAASKTIKVAINVGYPPLEQRNPSTSEVEGFDIDLQNAIAKRLGVKAEYQDGAFEQMTPSLQSGRVDVIVSGFYDLPKRRGMFDFIDYLRAGAQFFVAKTSDAKQPADLCGQTISAIRGTNFPDTTKAWSDKNCVAAGKQPIAVIVDTDLGQQLSNIKQGRAQGGVQGLESVPSTAEMDNNGYRALGDPFSSTLMGIAFRKDEDGLRDAYAATLKALIADGTYATLIKKWKLDLSAYTDVTLNQGPAP